MIARVPLIKRPKVVRWLAATAGLLALAALLYGASLPAGATQAPAPDQPKKEEPKKPELPIPGFPDIEELIKNLPIQFDPQQVEQMKKELERAREEMKKAMDQLRQGRGGRGLGLTPAEEARLGARLEKPSAALADQLDLPNGQGLVIDQVQADSAAAKAGIKANDILLELNGKPVSSDSREFAKMVEDIKPNTPVNAVVLRKGKKETIKGLSLPEAPAANPRIRFPGGGLPNLPNLPNIPGLPGGVIPGLPGAGGPAQTTVTRINDQFTARHQDGTLLITVKGTVADGKAKVSEIEVKEGANASKYDSVDKVPEKHRDQVKKLIEMSEKDKP